MTKNAYIAKLRKYLSNMPKEEIEDIVYDYEEHFRLGLADGKSEDEIALSLGDAKAVAKLYKADFTIEKARSNASTANIVKAVLVAIELSFFNLIFVLGPFCAVIGALLGLFGASIGITVGGVLVVAATMLQQVFPGNVDFGGADKTFVFSFAVGISCLGMLLTLGNVWLSKWVYRLTIRYLKWNIAIIKSKEVNVDEH